MEVCHLQLEAQFVSPGSRFELFVSSHFPFFFFFFKAILIFFLAILIDLLVGSGVNSKLLFIASQSWEVRRYFHSPKCCVLG